MSFEEFIEYVYENPYNYVSRRYLRDAENLIEFYDENEFKIRFRFNKDVVGVHKFKAGDNKYDLTELDVVAAHDICFKILEEYRKFNGFGVPCYHSCKYTDFVKKNIAKCKAYHGVEGGALFDATSKKLIGIATWGVYFPTFELPVGFSAVNSENFFKDLTCAKRIRADNQKRLTKGYYQNLCNGK